MPWDPFMRSEKAVQILGEEHLEIAGHGVVVLQPLVLRISKLIGEFAIGAVRARGGVGPAGFYAIAVAASLSPVVGAASVREGGTQQAARIRLDFTNDLDSAWDINDPQIRATFRPMPCARISSGLRKRREKFGLTIFTATGVRPSPASTPSRCSCGRRVVKHHESFPGSRTERFRSDRCVPLDPNERRKRGSSCRGQSTGLVFGLRATTQVRH